MKKSVVLLIVLFVFSFGSSGVGFAEEKTIKDVPLIMAEVKKDVPIKEFYDTNSLIRSRMFYQTFLERFAKANNMTEGGFNVLPIGIYFIPVDGVFFKNTKTGVYPAMIINAEPGMTLDEWYRTNSFINRKLSWNFFKERFAEFQEIKNSEDEFKKLKPGAWIMPIANVFFWTPQGIKSPLEMTFKTAKEGLYSAEFKKEFLIEPKKPMNLLLDIFLVVAAYFVAVYLLLLLLIFGARHLIKAWRKSLYLNKNKETQKESKQDKTTYI